MKRPECVLFDLDGTLVDTAPDLGYAANAVRGELGMPPLDMALYRPHASGGARALLKVALDIDDADPAFPARRDAFLSVYRNNLSRASRLFDGVNDLLGALEAKRISWGVVTNKPDWLAQPLLAELGLSSRATCAIGAQDGFQPKPAPDLLLHAAELTGVEASRCAYVGDDRRDVDAGRAAGMHTVVAGWGYISETGDVAGWGADGVIQSPGELTSLWD